MIDLALEANRRVAWARFYAARRDLRHLKLWAAELAEWIEQNDVDPPAVLADLMVAVRADLSEADRATIRRFVTYHRNAA